MEHESRRVSLKGLISHAKTSTNDILLHHVEDLFGSVQPNIVVWNCHRLEGDLLCILEIGVWPPDPVEPFYG